MNRFTKISLLAVSALAAAVVAVGCSSPSGPEIQTHNPNTNPQTAAGSPAISPTNGLVQTSNGGSVVVEAKWIGERGSSLVFDISMNTHSVNLDQYNLGDLAVLQDDEGSEYRPTSWQAPTGGHHRQGTLAFPLPDSLEAGDTGSLELVIRDVAGVKERVMKWVLGS